MAIAIKNKPMNIETKINDLDKTAGLLNTKVWTLLHKLATKKNQVSYRR